MDLTNNEYGNKYPDPVGCKQSQPYIREWMRLSTLLKNI